MDNIEFYEETELDGKVPFVKIGTPVEDDATVDAIDDAIETTGAESEPLYEIGTPMTGELFAIETTLQETLRDELGEKLPADAVAIVRWSLLEADGESVSTIHWLTRSEHDEIDGHCISRLIERVVLADGSDALEKAASALTAEWERR